MLDASAAIKELTSVYHVSGLVGVPGDAVGVVGWLSDFIKTISRDMGINIFRNTKDKYEPYWRDVKNKWREKE